MKEHVTICLTICDTKTMFGFLCLLFVRVFISMSNVYSTHPFSSHGLQYTKAVFFLLYICSQTDDARRYSSTNSVLTLFIEFSPYDHTQIKAQQLSMYICAVSAYLSVCLLLHIIGV